MQVNINIYIYKDVIRNKTERTCMRKPLGPMFYSSVGMTPQGWKYYSQGPSGGAPQIGTMQACSYSIYFMSLMLKLEMKWDGIDRLQSALVTCHAGKETAEEHEVTKAPPQSFHSHLCPLEGFSGGKKIRRRGLQCPNGSFRSSHPLFKNP